MVSQTLSAFARSAHARHLFQSGSATSREIFETEFGHFPPKGLDFANQNSLDKQIKIKSCFEDKDMGWLGKTITAVAAYGYVHGKKQIVGSEAESAPKDQSIYLNPVILGPVGRTFGALFTYTMAKNFLSDLSLTGMVDFITDYQLFSLMLFATSLRYMPLTQLANIPFRSYADILGHEHIHILQVHDKERANTGYDMDRDLFKGLVTLNHDSFSGFKKYRKLADNVLSLGTSRYLLNDVEVQARLHTIIANGYHRWGQIPRTKMEFYAACIDSGLNVPKPIRDLVRESSDENIHRFLPQTLSSKFFRAARKYLNCDASELNAAQRSVMDANLEKVHWQVTLPFMYGHLLELYGDPRGRIKMGFYLEEQDGQLSRFDATPKDRMTAIRHSAPHDTILGVQEAPQLARA